MMPDYDIAICGAGPAGMAAALPWVDDFVEGHSLAALERLAAVLSGLPDPAGEDQHRAR